MQNVTITNGVIKRGATIKTGDFENKRGDIELSFTVAEGSDASAAISHVNQIINVQLIELLGEGTMIIKTSVTVPAEEKKPGKKAAKLPKEEKPAVEEDDPLADRAPLPGTIDATGPKPPKPREEAVVNEDDLGDLLGTGEAAKEITDKELTDAAQKCQAANKNAPAIRKILAELGIKVPPGRIIDLPQEKRQSFLDKLKEVKPLA